MKALGTAIATRLEQPTSTWENKPSFIVESSADQSKITMSVTLNGETQGNKEYGWVDDGTPVHDVTSTEKHAKIPMPGTFSAKSIPGTMTASEGSKGTARFLPKGYPVMSGIKARKFTEIVAKEWEEAFPNSMVNKINEIADELI
jgi:hypothetical protein